MQTTYKKQPGEMAPFFRHTPIWIGINRFLHFEDVYHVIQWLL